MVGRRRSVARKKRGKKDIFDTFLASTPRRPFL
jgi:hypothetical protein